MRCQPYIFATKHPPTSVVRTITAIFRIFIFLAQQFYYTARGNCPYYTACGIIRYKCRPEVQTSSTAAVKRRQTIPVYRACSISAREFFRLLHRQPSSDFRLPSSDLWLHPYARVRALASPPRPTSSDLRLPTWWLGHPAPDRAAGILPASSLSRHFASFAVRISSLQSSIINYQSSISSASLGVLGALAFQNLPLQSSILNPQSSILNPQSLPLTLPLACLVPWR